MGFDSDSKFRLFNPLPLWNLLTSYGKLYSVFSFEVHVRKISAGKLTIFPIIHLLHLHREFRVAWGFSLGSSLTHSHMPDTVSVRQVDGLPPASFRFHLAMDTLASGYALGATPCARDFHPLDCARAAHTTIRRVSELTLLLSTI